MGGFLAIIILVAIMSIFTYFKIGELTTFLQETAHQNIYKTELVQGTAIDIANEAVAMRRFNYTGDIDDIKIFQEYQKQADDKMKKLEETLRTENGRELIKKVREEKNRYEAIAEKSFEAKRKNNVEQVGLYMQQAGEPYKNAMAAAQQLVEAEKELAKTEEIQSREQAFEVQMMLLIVNILVAIISIAISFYISQSIAKPVTCIAEIATQIANGSLHMKDVEIKTSDEIGELGESFNRMKKNLRDIIFKVANSSEQLAASSEQLTASAHQSADVSNQVAESITEIAHGAEMQANSADQIMHVAKTMSDKVRQISQATQDVSNIALSTSQAAEQGHDAVDQTVEQMDEIGKSANTTQTSIAELSRSSQEIGEIVSLISSIAGQTNLLALNAAIEAARAGEQGRGFAVVAEEVRKLAEESNQAAHKIGTLVDKNKINLDQVVIATQESANGIQTGISLVHNTGATFKKIVDSIVGLSNQIKDISQSIQQISIGNQELVDSIQEIDIASKKAAAESQNVSAATEEQSASMQEIASSSQSLAMLATELQTAIEKFRL